MLAQVGDTDEALELIVTLPEEPSWLSPKELGLDPLWDPLRDDPRFQALLSRYDPPQPVTLN